MKVVASRSQVDSDADSGAGPGGAHQSRARRAMRTGVEEIGQLHLRVRAVHGLSSILPQFCFNRLRTSLYRAAKVSIGQGSLLMGDVILSGTGNPSLLSIGADTYITGPLRIDLGGSVQIGNNVNIGHDCFFATVDHEVGSPMRRAGPSTYRPIVIEDGAWIASRVTILPGRTVGQGAVVAAGAVVASDVAPHTLVGGVPARVIRRLGTHG